MPSWFSKKAPQAPESSRGFIASLVGLLQSKSETERIEEDRAGLGLLHQGRREAFEEVLGYIRVSRYWPSEPMDDVTPPVHSGDEEPALERLSPADETNAKRDAVALVWADVEATRATENPPLDHPELVSGLDIVERWAGHEGALIFALAVFGSQAVKLLSRLHGTDPAEFLREVSLLVMEYKPDQE